MADGGDNVAKVYAIVLYREGTSAVPKNVALGRKVAVALLPWLRAEAAAEANVHALFGLGHCYEYGSGGVAVDLVEALKWYRLAADQGLAAAQHNVGCWYEQGRGGVSFDLVEALKWFRLAAGQGHAGAQTNVDTLWFVG